MISEKTPVVYRLGYERCENHKDAMCYYNTNKHSQCPFCAAQTIINPDLDKTGAKSFVKKAIRSKRKHDDGPYFDGLSKDIDFDSEELV